jgi:hypothetical protein
MGGRLLQFFVYAAIVIGGALAAVGLVLAYHTYTFSHHAQQASGVVLENISRVSHDSEGKDQTYYYPRVRFHIAGGQDIVFEGDAGSAPPAHAVGETVTVLYAPQDPKHAIIKDWTMWFLAGICGLIGTIFAGIGSGVLVWQQRRKRMVAWLREHGKQIDAEFSRVEQNTSLTVNEKHPYRIVCQCAEPKSKRVHVFKSDNFWFDPEAYTGKTLKVTVDPADWARYFVHTEFLADVDENRHHTLRERFARKVNDYRKRWQELRERSLDYLLAGAYFLSIVGLFSLTGVSWKQEMLFAAILIVGFTQFSLWHRRSVGWQWPGPQEGAGRDILFIAGVTAVLCIGIAWIVPFSKVLPWYLLIVGIVGYLVLKELGVVADSEAPAKHPISHAAESNLKRAGRLMYQAMFVLVWLAAIVAFCFRDYLRSYGARASTLVGAVTTLAWVGVPVIVLATPLLHYVLGIEIYPQIGRSVSQSPQKRARKRSAA